MTKKTVFFTALLLTAILLFPACTYIPKNQAVSTETQTVTQDIETGTQAPLPTSVRGIWYDASSLVVLELCEDLTARYFQLYPGYYEYSYVSSGTYTIQDDIIKLSTGTETRMWRYTFNTDGALSLSSDGSSLSFTSTETLPTEHPVYEFADYAAMNCGQLVLLGAYSGITFSESEILTAAADKMREEYWQSNTYVTPPEVTDRAAAYGDGVVIDYVGKLDGVAFDRGSAENQKVILIKDNGYIPGFAEGIIGHSIGETFDVPVTFPENYGNEMAGKAAIFTMTLHKILDRSLTDEMVNIYTNGEYPDYASLLQLYLKEEKSESIWEKIIDNLTCESVPEEAYRYFYQYYLDRYHNYAYQYQTNYETILSMVGITDNQLLEKAKNIALNYIATFAIAEKENIQWNEKQLEEKIRFFADDYRSTVQCTEEEAVEYIRANELEYVKADLMNDLVNDWLFTNNIFE